MASSHDRICEQCVRPSQAYCAAVGWGTAGGGEWMGSIDCGAALVDGDGCVAAYEFAAAADRSR